MVKILVIGSLDLTDKDQHDFVTFLAQEIVGQGHILLNGCRNEFDKVIAESANALLQEKGEDAGKFIFSYLAPGIKQAHDVGRIVKSQCKNWESLAEATLEIPETLQEADVVLIVGGTDGTKRAANWARITRKPLMPITLFGGSAAEIFNEELKKFDGTYSRNIEKSDYETLNQVSSDMHKIAKESVSLAARSITSKHVFIIMSFANLPHLRDAYESFKDVCKEFDYLGEKIDDSNTFERIVKEILERIDKAAFVIVDLTEAKPNVYYELGVAQGLGRQVIVTAFKGTPLPFDVADIPTIMWEGQTDLKERLREKIKTIALRQGRL